MNLPSVNQADIKNNPATSTLAQPASQNGTFQRSIKAEKASKSEQVQPSNILRVAAQADFQWLFTKSDIELTPSVLMTAMDSAKERQLRTKGINTIYRIGDFMRLGQHVLNTACIFFHRFYMRKPLQDGPIRIGYSHYEIAATCIFLACKVEETHRKLSTVIDATMASLDKSPEGIQKWADRTFRASPNSKEYGRWRDIILVSEETLLETLCFDLIVEHPHEILVKAAYRLDVGKAVSRLAWSILNDSFRHPVCIMFEASVLAAGAFVKACKANNVDPTSHKASCPSGTDTSTGVKAADTKQLEWTQVFDVDQEEAQEACQAIEEQVYEMIHSEPSTTTNAVGETLPLQPAQTTTLA